MNKFGASWLNELVDKQLAAIPDSVIQQWDMAARVAVFNSIWHSVDHICESLDSPIVSHIANDIEKKMRGALGIPEDVKVGNGN